MQRVLRADSPILLQWSISTARSQVKAWRESLGASSHVVCVQTGAATVILMTSKP